LRALDVSIRHTIDLSFLLCALAPLREDVFWQNSVVTAQNQGTLTVAESAKQKAHISFTLNGEPAEVAFAPHKTLLEVLREDLGLTGTKHGCELGECGTCAVLVDGRSILSCLMLGLDAEGRGVTSIEGMAEGGTLHPLQETFADLGAAQCGYCSPGFLLVARELLDKKPRASRDEIKEALSGNLCRCTGYIKIYEAVELAAARMRGEAMELPRESLYGCE
jgi:carbon-monoxide dehydrogenase small subunit